jgi:nucleoside-diphosphate-sugar epimerase
MKVLMVGATGKYASHVVPELKQRAVTIRALVRDKDKIDAAQQQGADEAVVGDRSIVAIFPPSRPEHRVSILAATTIEQPTVHPINTSTR